MEIGVKKTEKLTNINVCPFIFEWKLVYNDNFIIGKSSIESNMYDILVFSNRNLKIAVIPSFIKHIKPYSFSDCLQLKTIEIPNNSELQTTDEGGF